jgi:hypothetical protein
MNKKPKPMTPEEIAQLKARMSIATRAIMDHLKKHGTIQGIKAPTQKKGGK